MWTTRRLLAWMNDAFAQRSIDSPRLAAEMLLSHVLGCDRLRLYMESDRPASPMERQRLRELVARALTHEPIQYLVGEAWFYGLPMLVDRRVLVPRACTQVIVEQVVQHVRARPGFGGKTGESLLIADVCTGSGCIAIALAKTLKDARMVATDVSAEALDVARHNAARHEVADRIDFLEGDLLEPMFGHAVAGARGALGALVSNPPYIPDHEWAEVPPNVREHEPTLALRGGADGLKFVRPLIQHGPALLRAGGLLAIEIASVTAERVIALAEQSAELIKPRIVRDEEGKDRTLIAERAD